MSQESPQCFRHQKSKDITLNNKSRSTSSAYRSKNSLSPSRKPLVTSSTDSNSSSKKCEQYSQQKQGNKAVTITVPPLLGNELLPYEQLRTAIRTSPCSSDASGQTRSLLGRCKRYSLNLSEEVQEIDSRDEMYTDTNDKKEDFENRREKNMKQKETKEQWTQSYEEGSETKQVKGGMQSFEQQISNSYDKREKTILQLVQENSRLSEVNHLQREQILSLEEQLSVAREKVLESEEREIALKEQGRDMFSEMANLKQLGEQFEQLKVLLSKKNELISKLQKQIFSFQQYQNHAHISSSINSGYNNQSSSYNNSYCQSQYTNNISISDKNFKQNNLSSINTDKKIQLDGSTSSSVSSASLFLRKRSNKSIEKIQKMKDQNNYFISSIKKAIKIPQQRLQLNKQNVQQSEDFKRQNIHQSIQDINKRPYSQEPTKNYFQVEVQKQNRSYSPSSQLIQLKNMEFPVYLHSSGSLNNKNSNKNSHNSSIDQTKKKSDSSQQGLASVDLNPNTSVSLYQIQQSLKFDTQPLSHLTNENNSNLQTRQQQQQQQKVQLNSHLMNSRSKQHLSFQGREFQNSNENNLLQKYSNEEGRSQALSNSKQKADLNLNGEGRDYRRQNSNLNNSTTSLCYSNATQSNLPQQNVHSNCQFDKKIPYALPLPPISTNNSNDYHNSHLIHSNSSSIISSTSYLNRDPQNAQKFYSFAGIEQNSNNSSKMDEKNLVKYQNESVILPWSGYLNSKPPQHQATDQPKQPLGELSNSLSSSTPQNTYRTASVASRTYVSSVELLKQTDMFRKDYQLFKYQQFQFPQKDIKSEQNSKQSEIENIHTNNNNSCSNNQQYQISNFSID